MEKLLQTNLSKSLFVDGVAEIDGAAGGNYMKASYRDRVAILNKIQGNAFFNTLRWEMVSVFTITKKFGMLQATKVKLTNKEAIT